MFELFTQYARKTVESAEIFSQMWRHNKIGTGHLLAAFLSDDAVSPLYRVLRDQGVARVDVYEKVGELYKAQNSSSFPGFRSFTPEAKDTLRDAADVANDFGHTWVWPAHIFASMLRRSCTAVYVLESVGVHDIGWLSEQVVPLMQASPNVRLDEGAERIVMVLQSLYSVTPDALEGIVIKLVDLDEGSPEYHLELARFYERQARRMRKLAKSAT